MNTIIPTRRTADRRSLADTFIAAMPYLDGVYFFADFASEQIWTFRYDGQTKSDFQNRTTKIFPDAGTINRISSFGEDEAGELYIIDLGGEIFKLLPLWGDTNDDGLVDLNDLNNVRNNFGGASLGDTDIDGDVDLTDLNNVRNDFLAERMETVPEPATAFAVVIGLVQIAAGAYSRTAFARGRKRRRTLGTAQTICKKKMACSIECRRLGLLVDRF